MFKKLFLAIFIAVIAFASVNAEGFKNVPSEAYYEVPFTYSVEDWSPAISDNFYVAISFDNGITYSKITDITEWGSVRPTIKTFEYIPRNFVSNVLIGLFVNPNNIWDVLPIQISTINFIQSEGKFISIPVEMYNGGNYTTTALLYKETLPHTITMQYCQSNPEVWETIGVFEPHTNLIYYFTNTNYTSDVKFRYVYNDTPVVIAQSELIPVHYRDTYFRFKTYGGDKALNDVVQLLWEKSNNFDLVHVKIMLNDSVLSTTPYLTDNINLNFNQTGIWKVIGIVESPGFRIEQVLIFNVTSPCETLIVENLALKDSIIHLNKEIITKNEKIEYLIKYIKDSTTYNLIYQNGETDIKDTKLSKDIIDARYNNGNIFLNSDLQGSLTAWLFDASGTNIIIWNFNIAPTQLDVSLYTTGTYFLWILNNNTYSLYKFIKI